MKIFRKIIGYVIIANIIPLLLLLSWNFSSDKLKYEWWVPYCSGFLLEIIIALGFFIVVGGFALIED